MTEVGKENLIPTLCQIQAGTKLNSNLFKITKSTKRVVLPKVDAKRAPLAMRPLERIRREYASCQPVNIINSEEILFSQDPEEGETEEMEFNTSA